MFKPKLHIPLHCLAGGQPAGITFLNDRPMDGIGKMNLWLVNT